jgi:hypothetical protein
MGGKVVLKLEIMQQYKSLKTFIKEASRFFFRSFPVILFSEFRSVISFTVLSKCLHVPPPLSPAFFFR